MASDFRYEIILFWSKADQAYIAEVPELAGVPPTAASYQEAVAERRGGHRPVDRDGRRNSVGRSPNRGDG